MKNQSMTQEAEKYVQQFGPQGYKMLGPDPDFRAHVDLYLAGARAALYLASREVEATEVPELDETLTRRQQLSRVLLDLKGRILNLYTGPQK